MWRAEDLSAEDEQSTRTDPVKVPVTGPTSAVTGPHAVTVGDARFQPVNIAAPSWERWRDELERIGGTSPLIHFEDTPRTRIELSTTHPSGLAQFITGKTTLLSNLIREDIAFRTASAAASTLTAKAVELAATRGIDSMHLAIGLAEWRFEKQEFRGPVLLRPLAIRRYGRDFELRLKGALTLNPGLVRAMEEQYGIVLDPAAFVALALQAGAFKPQPVIDRLRELTAHLQRFSVQPRLLISSFAEVGPALLADAEHLGHPVLDAVAGNPAAIERLTHGVERVEVLGQDERPPTFDTAVLDADPEQEQIVAQIAAGDTLAVHTLPGTGATQTIVNALGALVAKHRRVLVVSPRHATLRGVATRLADVGLGGLAVSPRTLRRDLIASISRNEKAAQPETGEVDEALVRLRSVLLDYRSALTRRDPQLRVSVLDALGELSRLALLPEPPATTARLSTRAVEALAIDRASVAAALQRAAALGEFRYGPGDSPWYGAMFSTADAAATAHRLAKRLSQADVPRLLERANALLASTRLRPFTTLAELGIYLRLLLDIRETLDKFVPAVFDRSLGELIVATGPRRDAREMSSVNRRRLKKLAREYVRPGVHIADLNDWLVRVQQQRVLHQRFVTGGVTPDVPAGITDLWTDYQRAASELTSLDEPLGTANTPDSLLQMPIDFLPERLAALAADSEVLHNLQDRTQLVAELRDLDLAPLLEDLAGRHVAPEQVAVELELAWWKSVLERMLADDPALLGANTTVLDRLEQDFRLVDEAHQKSNGKRLAWQLADAWRLGVTDWPGEAEALRQLLQAKIDDPVVLHREAPHLLKLLAPVWLASPYEVHELGDAIPFDTVFVVDAAALSVAEGIGAVRRAKQVVAFGDPVTQTPSPFDIAVRETEPPRETQRRLDERAADSVFSRLADLVPSLELTTSYRAGGEDLAEAVNRRFYEGRIESVPWAGTFLGHGSLVLDYVDNGHGLPDAETGTVEAVEPEVQRVVDRVIEHAQHRPRESLMVISGSAKHAVRVQQAVLKALVRRGDLMDFFVRDQPEPFMAVTLAEAVGHSRDRVIFSVGYGRTPHGRVLASLGPLAQPGGERLLAAAATRARRGLAVVSCFRPEDLEGERMPQGVLALRRLLADAEARVADTSPDDERDAMLVDLARRLRVLGMRASLGYHGKLALVASYGSRAITVETDATLGSGTLRQSLRLKPEMLKRLGWHYLRVHSFDLFSDPDAVAQRIAIALGAREPSPLTNTIPIVEVRP
ncbi:AAA family ATPase [Amnibacterium sp. CER49]|uniref:AAA family ATPase n=1 Tax=Amnibacterium sp. CER49 TaxID=3039161 RepID=UPI002448F328|nr:AAA family ATPase [Amnibacterium sp. CER49]MDH2444178.1 AAA family ATPase [Amnibacterium sp. CER49]